MTTITTMTKILELYVRRKILPKVNISDISQIVSAVSYRKDSRLPEQLQRVMAAEAEAAREARAKVIRASGEEKATRALRQAADELVSPSALQLRYLQVNVVHNKRVLA